MLRHSRPQQNFFSIGDTDDSYKIHVILSGRNKENLILKNRSHQDAAFISGIADRSETQQK